MLATDPMAEYHRVLKTQAEHLAGGLGDLAQRATVYHHLYEHSGGNHVFPLIAAHGALWARGYFRRGLALGWWCSWQYAGRETLRRERLGQLAAFADAFREINRLVCIDTYTSYHFAEVYGDDPRAAEFVATEKLSALRRMHAAKRNGERLDDEAKREVFQAFFLSEQQTVVGPQIAAATELLDWPLVKALAIRPLVRFAYFPGQTRMWFRNFLDQDERIARGLRAFQIGTDVGWETVAATLREYAVLPAAFFSNTARYFESVREAVLCGS